MSFQPVVPLAGFGGWAFLNRTLERQQEVFARSPIMQRETDHFRERIRDIGSAEELVADRRLLRVALGAFGLEDDIANRAFIQRVLESSTENPRSLANRLADKRYLEFARAFGFGEETAPLNQKDADFGARIVAAYRERQFEVAVGDQDDTMRLALALRRDLAALAARDSSERALWFSVLGNPPVRKVFETAFNLPPSFGAIDLDQQLTVLQDRTQRAFGDPSVTQFRDPERIEQLVRRFMSISQLQAGPGTSAGASTAALQLLQSGQAGLLRTISMLR